MTRTLSHRGPDDEGYVLAGDVVEARPLPHCVSVEDRACFALGHRRLSIQDLSSRGRQPMAYLGRYWLIYNGEIYNFPELRSELQSAGYLFSTGTDTEVVLAAYDRWGAHCVDHFNGMWALVLIDLQERVVFVSRDRFGIKPLFYCRAGGGLFFASEIKALLQHPEVPRRIALDRCRAYLETGTAEFEQATEFEGVRRFPAACNWSAPLDAIAGLEPEPESFWQPRLHTRYETFDPRAARQHAQAYRALLEDSVRLRLRADVRLGSALSGGLDSSSIVLLVNQLLGQDAQRRQLTFSSVYPTPETRDCDESEHIRTVSRALGVESHTITPPTEAFPTELRKLLYAMDTPPQGTCMSAWYTYKAALRQDVHVTLDGQGADELLAGYTGFFRPYLAHLPVRTLLREIPLSLRMRGARGSVVVGAAEGLCRGMLGTTWLANQLPWASQGQSLNPTLAGHLQLQLQDLLRNGDRLSMAHSVESRVPFMDYRLVEQLLRVPAGYKVHDGWTKYLARRAFDRRLPASITWRRDKQGWPVPERHWLSGPLRGWMQDTMSASPLLCELGVGRNAAHRVADPRTTASVVRELNLAIWYDVFFEHDCAEMQGVLGRANV